MMTDDTNQRSVGWYRSRMGFITGSRVGDIMKTGRKKDEIWSDTAKSYILQVASERLFNPKFLNDDDVFQDYIDQTNHTTKAMQWGIEQEDAAKSLFISMNSTDEQELVYAELSSCRHDTIPHFAASPDGLVYKRGEEGRYTLEVKCPNLNTYMKYRVSVHDATSLKEVEAKYYWQVLAEMSCTGAIGAYFIVYCPWLTKPIHWVCIKREEVEDDIKVMEDRVILANEEIEKIINQ